MKNFYPVFILVFLLSACTSAAQASIEEPVQAAYSTPTGNVSGSVTEDPILNSISVILSSGPHGLKYSCEDCHASLQDGAGQQLIWFNEAAGKTESVSTSTELCTKCHPDQLIAGMPQDGTQLAHLDFGCTDCHNAHSTQANCTQSACHADVRGIITIQIERPEPHPTTADPNSYMCGGSACHDLAKKVAGEPIYHQPVHRQVACYICHDVTGMAVTQGDDQAWFTVGEVTQQAAVSHTIARVGDCTKCHYSGNPWGLIESVPVIPTPIGIP